MYPGWYVGQVHQGSTPPATLPRVLPPTLPRVLPPLQEGRERAELSLLLTLRERAELSLLYTFVTFAGRTGPGKPGLLRAREDKTREK